MSTRHATESPSTGLPPKEIGALRDEAQALAELLASTATELASDGTKPDDEIVRRLDRFIERFAQAASALGSSASSLDELERHLTRARTADLRLNRLRDLNSVRATTREYNEALSELSERVSEECERLAADRGREPSDVESTLLWLLSVLEGEETVGADSFASARERVVAGGLDEKIALGLFARQLTLTPAGEGVPEIRVASEAPGPVTEAEPAFDKARGASHSVAEDEPPVPSGATRQATEVVTALAAATDDSPGPPPAAATDDSPGPPPAAATDDSPGPPPAATVISTNAEVSTASSHAVAADKELLSRITDASWTELERGRLSLAHWLLRYCEIIEADPPIPAVAVAALIASDHTKTSGDDFAAAYEEYALDALTLDDLGLAASLTLCAGALRAAVALPYGNAPIVLGTFGPRLEGALATICHLVAQRASRGELVQPGQLAAVARASADKEAAQTKLTDEAGALRTRARQETTNFVPAVQVWRQLVFHGEVGQILSAIKGGPPDAEAMALVERLSDARYVDREIARIYKDLRKKATATIESRARDWIRKNVARSLGLARRWLALHADGGPKDSGRSTGLSWLREQWRASSAALDHQVSTLLTHEDPAVRAAASALAQRLQMLDDYLLRGEPLPDPEPAATPEQAIGEDLALVLGLKVDDRFSVSDDELRTAGPALSDALDKSWETAFEERMRENRHDLTQLALSHLSPEQREPRERESTEALTRSRLLLQRQIITTTRQLDTALREQILPDAAYAEQLVRVRAVDVDALNVAGRLAEVQTIEETLRSTIAGRCRSLRAQLDALDPKAEDRTRVEALLEAQEIAVASEHLARLESGEDEPELLLEGPPVSQFVAFARTGEQKPASPLEALGENISERQIQPMRSLMKMDEPTAFRQPQKLRANLLRVVASLGLDPPSEAKHQERLAANLQLFDAPVRTAHGACPVPEFGSRAKGRYRIVVARGELRPRDVVNNIRGQNPRTGSPIMLLATQPLGFNARQALSHRALDEHVPFLIVDPWVLAYVCKDDSSRSPIQRFFDATLPFTWSNPYVTHGTVPPEMFFGRDEEMSNLLDPTGSAFIYGGRQLGKSALLVKALEEFHDPENGRCAIYLDLDAKRIGHAGATDLVWSHIGNEFEQALNTADAAGRDEEAVRTFILDWLADDERREMRILLDETDHFLERESYGGPDRAAMHNVIAMRDLMRQGEGRLKVVFAGLHSVQRFLHLPNQPFAQLGSPTPIGPLTWEHARRLVEAPLHALGYTFDEHVIDRILTLTNRHPSLIQHVCRALVDHLSRRARREVPWTISLQDLESVYEDRGLRVEIRKRFDWTLDLDPRYRVLAYSLALASLEAPPVQANGMTGTELLREARAWWPEGFDAVSRETVVSLCDEMVQLHVFSEQDGRYRLWSPNIMQLLGTRTEIEDKLLSEHDRDHATPLELGRNRRALGLGDDPRRSPLTYADETRLLDATAPSIRLVFGTPATQVDSVLDALSACARSPDWPQLEVHDHRRVPGAGMIVQGTETTHALNVAAVSGVDASWLHTRIRELSSGLAHGTSLVLILGGETLDFWDELVTDLELDGALTGAYREVTLKRWDVLSIGQWLDEIHMPTTTQEERNSVFETTGGWPLLVERFGEHARANDKRLEPTVHATAADTQARALLVQGLQLERLEPLQRCARMVAEIGEPVDASTLVEFADGAFSMVEASAWLHTLVMAQAGMAVERVSEERGSVRVDQPAVSIEPYLAHALS